MWIMDVMKVTNLISTCILIVNGVNGKTVSINKDLTGELGSARTFIECLINMNGIRRIREVSVYAAINKTLTAIITFKDYGETELTAAGEYLRNRVTYNTINGQSSRTELRFNKLLCEDDADYQCLLLFEPDLSGPSVTVHSEVSHLTVTVPPSIPSNLTVLKHNRTFLEMASQKHAVENLTFVEDDVITIVCTGQVGKPPGNLTMQKILSNDEVYNVTPENLVNDEMPNCSFIQRFIYTTTLTGDDNGLLLRCAVDSRPDIFIETSNFDVLYPVRTPAVTISSCPPTKSPVMLNCQGKGNPDPDYTWFKLSNNSFERYRSKQNITLYNLKGSEVYMCEVNNSIDQNSYSSSKNITVPCAASQNEDKDHNTTYTVIAIASGVCILIVIAFGIIVWNKMRKSKQKQVNNEEGNTTDNTKNNNPGKSRNNVADQLKSDDPDKQMKDDPDRIKKYVLSKIKKYGSDKIKKYGSGKPKNNDFHQPKKIGSVQPKKENSGQPKKDESGQPKNNDPGQQKKDDSGQPKNDGSGQPKNNGLSQPKNDDSDQQKKDNSSQQMNDDFGQPKNDDPGQPKNYDPGQPKNDGLSQPKNDGFGQPKNDVFGQPKNDGLSQPKNDGFGQPKNDDPGQPKMMVSVNQRMMAPGNQRMMIPVNQRMMIPVNQRIMIPVNQTKMNPGNQRMMIPVNCSD